MHHSGTVDRDSAEAGEGRQAAVKCGMCGVETHTIASSCPRCGAPLDDEESALNLLLSGTVDDHTRARPLPGPVTYLPAESEIPQPTAAPAPPGPPRTAVYEPPGSTVPPPPPIPEWTQQAALASAGQRLGAYLIDTLVLTGMLFVMLLGIGLFTSVLAAISESLVPVARVFGWLVLLAVPFGYLLVFNARGQTLGKRVLRIAVVDRASGRPIGIGRSAARTAMMMVMGLPLGLGYLSIPLSMRLRGWHDQVADDVVVTTSTGETLTTRL